LFKIFALPLVLGGLLGMTHIPGFAAFAVGADEMAAVSASTPSG